MDDGINLDQQEQDVCYLVKLKNRQ